MSENKGSVSNTYARTVDCGGKTGPRRCLFGHTDEMEPVQVAVQILRGDAAIAPQGNAKLISGFISDKGGL